MAKDKKKRRRAIAAHKEFLQGGKFKQRIVKPKKGRGSFRRTNRGKTPLE